MIKKAVFVLCPCHSDMTLFDQPDCALAGLSATVNMPA